MVKSSKKIIDTGKNGPNMAYLKDMAKKLGISGYSKLAKPALIHAIQLAEGNNDCYGRVADCSLSECLFYIPCQQA